MVILPIRSTLVSHEKENRARGQPLFVFPDEVRIRVSTLYGIVSLHFYSEVLYAETTFQDFDELRHMITKRTMDLFDMLRGHPILFFVRDPIRIYRRRRVLAEIDASFPVSLELRGRVTDALQAMHSDTQKLLLSKCLGRSNELQIGESEFTRLLQEYQRTHASPVRFGGYELTVTDKLIEIVSVFPKIILHIQSAHSMRPRWTDHLVWEFTDWTVMHARILYGGSPPTLPYSAKSRRGSCDEKLKLQVLVEVDGTVVVGCKFGDITGSLLVTPRDKEYLKNLVEEKEKIRHHSHRNRSYIDWDSVVKFCESLVAIV